MHSSDTYAKRPSRGAGFWSRADLGKLQFSFLFKDSLEETARKLDRSVEEVREKLQALGLLDPEPTASAVPTPLASPRPAPVLVDTTRISPPPLISGQVPVPAQAQPPAESERKPAPTVIAINVAADRYARLSEADLRMQAARERIAARVAGIGNPRFLRTKDEIETVLSLWRSKPVEQIAERLACTVDDVIECKRSHWTTEEINTLTRLREKGEYLANIAKMLELPEVWVREKAHNLGLPLVPKPKALSPIPPPKKIVPAHVKNAAKATRASRKSAAKVQSETAPVASQVPLPFAAETPAIAPAEPAAQRGSGKFDAKVKIRVKTRVPAPVSPSVQAPIQAASAKSSVTPLVKPAVPSPATQKTAPAPAAKPQIAASASRGTVLPKESKAAPASSVISAPNPPQPAPVKLAENWDVWDYQREMRLIDLYELGYSDSRMATELKTTAAEIRRMRKKLRL